MSSAPPLTLQLLLPALVPEPLEAWRAALPHLPALQRLLARAEKSASSCDHLPALLLASFGVERQQDWPAAPFSLLGDATDPGVDTWLLAEPVHLLAQRTSLVLADPRRLPLSTQESEALLATVNRHFAHAGLAFCAPQPHRWYLRLRQDLRARTTPPCVAVGRSIDAFLPQGGDALMLHGWFNEIQMLLHDHPVNAAREGRGEAAVNTLWLWGAGRLVEPATAAATCVWAEDPLLRGLARASGLPAHAPPAGAAEWLVQAQPGEHWILLDALAGSTGEPDSERSARAQALERSWFAPLLAALTARRLRNLTLATHHQGQALRFSVGPGDLWKVWRQSIGLVHG
jgi:hypothetical protein